MRKWWKELLNRSQAVYHNVKVVKYQLPYTCLLTVFSTDGGERVDNPF